MPKLKRLLITGGAGFIGSHCVLEAVRRGYEVVNLDSLTYAANLNHLSDIENETNYTFVQGDIRDKKFLQALFKKEKFDQVMHLAAESHVDFSIKNPSIFVETNVLGTENLLECALEFEIQKFLHVSTDEVYGELEKADAPFTEKHNLLPNSPYSASKASSDLLVRSYVETFGFKANITRCSNNYGPHQDLSKLIPKVITNALNHQKIPVYGQGQNIRDWLFVHDHVRALFLVLEKGEKGEVYNIGGNNEQTNIDLIKRILKLMGKPESLIEFVPDRPGHDWRYAIDATKIKNKLGWEPTQNFDVLLGETIAYYTGLLK